MESRETNLLKTIQELNDVKSEIKKIDDIICPPFEEKPISATLQEFDAYRSNKKKYDEVVELKSTKAKELKKAKEELELSIIKQLPASNTWFIIAGGKFAVGHRSDDWPSSNGSVLIVENPVKEELKEIRHQIVT